MLLMSAALILAAQNGDPFAKARADIGTYCRSIDGGSACVAKQRKELGHFATMMAGFNLPRSELAACMTKGKRGRFVDWTVATPCVRAKVKGRRIGS